MSKGTKVCQKDGSNTLRRDIPAAPVLPSMLEAYASRKDGYAATHGTKQDETRAGQEGMRSNNLRPSQNGNRFGLEYVTRVHQEYMHQIHFAHQQFLQGPWASLRQSSRTSRSTNGKPLTTDPSEYPLRQVPLQCTESDSIGGHLYFPALMRRVTGFLLSYLKTNTLNWKTGQWEIQSFAYQVLEKMPASVPVIPTITVTGRIRVPTNQPQAVSGTAIEQQGFPVVAEFELNVNDGDRTLVQIRNGNATYTNRPAHTQNELFVSGHESVSNAAALHMKSDDLSVFASGRLDLCFGTDYAQAATHVRPPSVSIQFLRFEEAEILQSDQGPAERVAARSRLVNTDNSKTESNLIADCIDAAFLLSSMAVSYSGFTLNKDGYRFEPALNQIVTVNCSFPQDLQGDEEISWNFTDLMFKDGEAPSVSGVLQAVAANRKIGTVSLVGTVLRLDYPISSYSLSPQAEVLEQGFGSNDGTVLEGLHELKTAVESEGASEVFQVDGFRYGKESLLSGAWGKPSKALGPLFRRFDNGTQMPRLPGPPFQFISRIVNVDGSIAEPRTGTVLTCEYDIPAESWYFESNNGVMPFSVLMEAALQPCGWLSGYMGIPLQSDEPLYFRNLDGTGTQYRDIRVGDGILRTVVTVKGISRVHSTFLQTYAVECFIGKELVFQVETVFGHFPKAGLDRQVGLPGIEQAERNPFEMKGTHTNLTDAEEHPQPLLPWTGTRLQMIDRIISVDAKPNDEGRARIVAEKTITPGEWFFRAHFLHDPVQPGSLGIESILQVLQWYMVHRGMVQDFTNPSFAAVQTGVPVSWKYRGQVLPKNKSVRVVVDVLDEKQQDLAVYVSARAVLWVDGHAIYESNPIGMEARDQSQDRRFSAGSHEQVYEWTVDPNQIWLRHHRPTYTVPVMPFMFLMDDIMKSVEESYPDRKVVEVADVKIHGWFVCDESKHVRATVTPTVDNPALFTVVISVWHQGDSAALSKFEQKMTAVVRTGKTYAVPPQSDVIELKDKDLSTEDPYESGRLFHGKSFQILKEITYGSNGSAAVMDVTPSEMPQERLRSLVLDSVTHAIPHDKLERWNSSVSKGQVAYPYTVTRAQFFSQLDYARDIQCEVRFSGFHQENKRFPMFTARLTAGGRLWTELELVEILFPTSAFVVADGRDRRKFLQDKQFVSGLSLARLSKNTARLSAAEVRNANWLAGTLESVYDISGSNRDLAKNIAEKELAANVLQVHPSEVTVEETTELIGDRDMSDKNRGERTDESTDASSVVASCASQPFVRLKMTSKEADGEWETSLKAVYPLNVERVHAFWQEQAGVVEWIIWDIYRALVKRFVGGVHITHPASFYSHRDDPVLFLANHQTGVESLLFSYLAGGLRQMPVVGLAKKEHRHSWIGRLLEMTNTYPPARLYRTMILFDRSNQKSMLEILRTMADVLNNERLSALIHVEGTRSTSTGKPPVEAMSSTLIDLAVSAQVPIVPVRFSSGLPADDRGTRYEFPVGWGRQDYWIGKSILPTQLESMEYADRKKTVIDAVNALGPTFEEETPYPGDEMFGEAAVVWREKYGVTSQWAVILQCLEEFPERSEQTVSFLESIKGNLDFAYSPYHNWMAQLFARMKEDRSV